MIEQIPIEINTFVDVFQELDQNLFPEAKDAIDKIAIFTKQIFNI